MAFTTLTSSAYATLDATKLSGNLPAISGASLTGISAGITEADNWRLTTNAAYSGSGRQVLTSNWERNDTNWEHIGTGMSQSSGIFTFPSTGKWLIEFGYMWTTADNTGTVKSYTSFYAEIEATTDNSSYDRIARGGGSNLNTSAERVKHNYASVMLDVTNTTNQKVRFGAYMPEGVFVLGSSSRNDTFSTFLKLGDT